MSLEEELRTAKQSQKVAASKGMKDSAPPHLLDVSAAKSKRALVLDSSLAGQSASGSFSFVLIFLVSSTFNTPVRVLSSPLLP